MTGGSGFQVAAAAAAAYDSFLVPAFFTPCATGLLELAPAHPGERVLDLAGGTGAVARLTAELVGRTGSVTVVDLNPAMIAYGSAKPHPPGAPIRWQQADAAALPLPDDSVDVAYCQQGLQFVADLDGAIAEIVRVLSPKGRFALAVWRSLRDNSVFADLIEVLQQHLPAGAAAGLRAALAGPGRQELRTRLYRAGFTRVRSRIAVLEVRFASPRRFYEVQVSGSPLAGPVGELSPTQQHLLAAEVERAMEPHRDDAGLLLPMQTWLVVAQL